MLEKQKNVNTHVFTSAKRNTGQIKTEANNSNNRNVICGGGQETGEKDQDGKQDFSEHTVREKRNRNHWMERAMKCSENADKSIN